MSTDAISYRSAVVLSLASHSGVFQTWCKKQAFATEERFSSVLWSIQSRWRYLRWSKNEENFFFRKSYFVWTLKWCIHHATKQWKLSPPLQLRQSLYIHRHKQHVVTVLYLTGNGFHSWSVYFIYTAVYFTCIYLTRTRSIKEQHERRQKTF